MTILALALFVLRNLGHDTVDVFAASPPEDAYEYTASQKIRCP
jgi:hypothetical protein